MQLVIKTLTGKTFTIDARETDCIENVKADIAAREGTAPDYLRLIFAGRQLEDSGALATYNVQDGATLTLVMRSVGR